MKCTCKHTKYQPPIEVWKCPECGIAPPEGLCVDESPNLECDLLHDDDTLICYNIECGYVTSGKKYAAQLMRKNNVIECPRCKGNGFIKK